MTTSSDDKRAAWDLTLCNMVTAPRVLYGSWLAAGLILLLLGRPFIALAFVLAGAAFDLWAQGRVRRYQTLAPPEGGWPLQLQAIVAIRFTLGVSGPLAVWVLSPTPDVTLVVLLIQAWSICVALVQFTCAPRLLSIALIPTFGAVVGVLAPSLMGERGAALGIAVILLGVIVVIIAREGHALWGRLFDSDRRNAALMADLAGARDQAVSDRDAANAARADADRANAAKSWFLANMSHEIRTPLNGVLGMAQVMAADPLPDTQRERLAIVHQSARTLLDLINQILDLSRIEEGRLEIDIQDVHLDALVDEIAQTLRPLADGKGLALRLQPASPPVGWVRTDPVRLRQILYNLLSNAIKFTTVGAVGLVVVCDGDRMVFTISDTGRGVPQDQRHRLFERFAQIEAGSQDRRDGAGLGLSITAALVERLGGDVQVESEVGQGTTFTVSLPMAQAIEAPIPGAAATRIDDQAAVRVLVAEDHLVNQRIIREAFAQLGLDATVVDNGRDAVEAWDQASWDIILMDVQMPELDGPGATREIRRREVETGRARTPILALTANTMVDQIDGYLDAGMDGVVAKPIDFQVLLDAMTKTLAKAETPSVASTGFPSD